MSTTLRDKGPSMSEDGLWFAIAGHDNTEGANGFLDIGFDIVGRNGWVRYCPEDNCNEDFWAECTEDEDGAEPATIID